MVDAQMHCYHQYGQQSMSVTATDARYYRSIKLWIYKNGGWVASEWSTPFVGEFYGMDITERFQARGWGYGYVEVAVWTTDGWAYYGGWARHFQADGYPNPSGTFHDRGDKGCNAGNW